MTISLNNLKIITEQTKSILHKIFIENRWITNTKITTYRQGRTKCSVGLGAELEIIDKISFYHFCITTFF